MVIFVGKECHARHNPFPLLVTPISKLRRQFHCQMERLLTRRPWVSAERICRLQMACRSVLISPVSPTFPRNYAALLLLPLFEGFLKVSPL